MWLSYIPQSIGIFCLLVFLDHILEEHVDSLRIALLSAIAGLYIWSGALPDSFAIIPDYGIHVVGLNRYFQILFIVFYMAIYFRWIFLTWRKAPPELHGDANILMIGAILLTVVAILIYAIGTAFRPLSPVAFFVHSIGVLLTVIVMIRQPKLVFVLPFIAHRVLVIDRESGLLLFEHRWSDQAKDKDLISSVVHGIQSASFEAFQVGEPQKIDLAGGVLMFQNVGNLTISLFSSKYSPYLAQCMKRFATEFEKEYKVRELSTKAFISSKDYNFGENLVRTYFENVPSRLLKING